MARQQRGAWHGGDGRGVAHARGTTNNRHRATPDQVFAFLTDPANDHRWRRHVKEISASGPLRPGSVVHQVVQGPAGRGIRADFEVTAFESPTRFAFNVTTGPVKPVGEFLFRPLGTGTEVTFSLVRN